MAPGDAAAVPPSRRYVLRRARVPLACLEGVDLAALEPDVDRLALVDIEVRDGLIHSITPAAAAAPPAGGARAALARLAGAPAAADLRGRMVLPTFVDLHTHIDKGHTAERSRNPDGSLSGADRSTAADAAFWDTADVERRMDFALRCAYAHGTSALRTHLINMTPKQAALTWPAFAALRARWAGRVELQGVSLVTLSFYRDLAAATALADTVAVAGGLLGAAVCCAEDGGDPADDFTTCEADRDLLLDRIFSLAKERDLDLDFHTDENGNAAARGLRYVSLKAIEHGYEGRVVCGHCCSLAAQPPAELAATLAAAAAARVTLVSLPLINLWTQDRHKAGGRTPRWRGVALLHEAAAAGVRVALASDNTRDQFYAYGDLDLLEVFGAGCKVAHLDRPYGAWPRAVSATPADAMRLPGHGRLRPGGGADFVLFRARRYSELLARPQADRVVVRGGRATSAQVPDYEELDFVPAAVRSGEVAAGEVRFGAGGAPEARARVGDAAALLPRRGDGAGGGNGAAPAAPAARWAWAAGGAALALAAGAAHAAL